MTVIAGSIAAGRLGAVTVAESSHLIYEYQAERDRDRHREAYPQ